jgi:hypothetical protein
MNKDTGNVNQVGVIMKRANAILKNATGAGANNGAAIEISGGVISTQQQPMHPTPLPTQKSSMALAEAEAQSNVQMQQLRVKVLHEQTPMILVDMLVDQNLILWKRIEEYEQKLNASNNQTKKDLHEQKSKHDFSLDKYKEQNFQLEQQCITLEEDSQKKCEEIKSLSQRLILVHDINSKLESALSQAGMSIRSVQVENQQLISLLQYQIHQGTIMNNMNVLKTNKINGTGIHQKNVREIIESRQKQNITNPNNTKVNNGGGNNTTTKNNLIDTSSRSSFASSSLMSAVLAAVESSKQNAETTKNLQQQLVVEHQPIIISTKRKRL